MYPENVSIYTSIGVWIDTVVGIINLHLLFCGVLGGKLRRKTAAVCLAVLVIGAAACLFSGYHLVAEILTLPVMILLPLLTVKGLSKRTLLYNGLLYVGMVTAVLYCVLWFLSLFVLDDRVTLGVTAVLDMGWLCLFWAMGAQKISGKLFKQIQWLSGGVKALLLAFLLVGGMVACMIRDLFFQYSHTKHAILLEVMVAVLVVLICIACPLLIVNHLSKRHYQTLSENMEQQVAAQVRHYEEMARANEDVRAFRHDFKNLQIELQQRLKENDTDGALACLQQYDGAVFQNAGFATGNRVADALLGAKQEVAVGQATALTFTGLISTSLPSADVCVLLGNAVDNALEACQKLPSAQARQVTVTAQCERGMQLLQIENPLPPGGVLPEVGRGITTKADPSRHGFGIAAMKKVVDTYRGSMTFRLRDGAVVLEIVFTLP